MRIEETELAWAAGFFDGEGNTNLKRCGVSKRYPDNEKWYPRVQIGQNEPTVLERFKAATGGEGTIVGPVWYPSMKNSKPRYTFQSTGGGAERVLQLLWPYLSEPKREQAREVLNADRRTQRGS